MAPRAPERSRAWVALAVSRRSGRVREEAAPGAIGCLDRDSPWSESVRRMVCRRCLSRVPSVRRADRGATAGDFVQHRDHRVRVLCAERRSRCAGLDAAVQARACVGTAGPLLALRTVRVVMNQLKVLDGRPTPVVLLVGCILGAIVILKWPGAAGLAGFLVTGVALLIAIAIYRRQETDSISKHREVRKDLKEIMKAVDVPLDNDEETEQSEAGPDGSPEAISELEAAFGAHGVRVDDGAAYLLPEDVPLRSIGDLVAHWEAQGVKGRWTVSNLVGAFRKPGANAAITVAFRDGSDRLRTWRLSRGGRGKSTATIRETTPDNR